MIPTFLETANLALRPFREDDARAVFEYWSSDPGWERYNASVPRTFTLADAEAFVVQMCERDWSTMPVWAALHLDRVVGIVSLTFEHGFRIATIGYGIHGDLRGRGFAAEIAAAVVALAFGEQPELRRIRAYTDAENKASMRVLEKLGFVHEGTLRKNQFAKGRFVDEAIFGLLREDWQV